MVWANPIPTSGLPLPCEEGGLTVMGVLGVPAIRPSLAVEGVRGRGLPEQHRAVLPTSTWPYCLPRSNSFASRAQRAPQLRQEASTRSDGSPKATGP